MPAKERLAFAWKNGGGQTWQIVAFPPDASLDDFEWRLSMARVANDGPFSTFAGVDRVLAVLEGGPLVLSFADDGARMTLDPTAAPFMFAGDRAVVGEAPAGALIDLNLMTRRGRRVGAIERLWIEGATMVGGAADSVVLALDAMDCGDHVLALHDAVMLDAGEIATLRPHGPSARALVATVCQG